MERSTLVDKVIYTRVMNIQEKVNATLMLEIMNTGYDGLIFIRTEEVDQKECRCGGQLRVVAYTEEEED